MPLRRDGSITVNVQKDDKTRICVVNVKGVIDTGTTLILEEHLSSLLRDQWFKLIINLGEVTYISSSGWGLFISLLQKTREQKGDIKLVAMRQEVKNVFIMLAFSNLISAYATVEEAAKTFNPK